MLALAAALGVGIAMELGQLFTVSGIAEGRSVLTRAAGVGIGLLLYAWRGPLLRPDLLARHGRALVMVAAVPYVLALFVLNTGGRGFHFDLARAGQTLADLYWLPFYYHYLVSQAAAIASVMLHMAMYAPVGLAVWLWGMAPYAPRRRRYVTAAAWAGALALVMETAKLFVADRHPDYTDVLIAMFAAATMLGVLSWLWRQSFASVPVATCLPPTAMAVVRTRNMAAASSSTSWFMRLSGAYWARSYCMPHSLASGGGLAAVRSLFMRCCCGVIPRPGCW